MYSLKKQRMKEEKPGKGFVMIVALIVTLIAGVVVGSLIGLTLQEYVLSARSAAYSKALHAAESGANLACEEFCTQIGGGGSAWSGWSSSGAANSTSGNITNSAGEILSSYSVSAVSSGSDKYIITSTGRASLAGKVIERTVRITVQQDDDDDTPRYPAHIVSGASIHMSGSVSVDSYDSTDPTKSTNGQYDPAKATHNATILTLSTDNPAIKADGGADLSGVSVLAVPEGATVSIAKWIRFTGSISHISDCEIKDVTVPISAPPSGEINVGPWPNQTQVITVNGLQDMSLESFKVTASGNLTIAGSGVLRIYVDGKTTVSGSGAVQITPVPSTADLRVEFYANDDVSISGSGVLNNTYRAASCSIWGTENCKKVKVSGNSGYTGTIYAPYAEVDLTGSSTASGAFLGGAVKFTGNTRFYVDESLIGGSPPPDSPGSEKLYKLIQWIEL